MLPPQPDFPPPIADSPSTLDQALGVVRFLRTHCPWDAAQTHRSLAAYLLEEAYETVDAAVREDDDGLCDELGDLLLNVAFQIVLAEERGAFDAAAVVAGLQQKMRRRHPHLWGDGPAEPWEEIKRRERPDYPNGLLTGMRPVGDPLLRAQRMQERVAKVGFDWADAHGALAKVREEIDEVEQEIAAPSAPRLATELGDLLFSVVNLARLLGTNASTALVGANGKFAERFAALERIAGERGLAIGEVDLAVLDDLWEEAKRQERMTS